MTANAGYSVALGRAASANGKQGAFVFGDASTDALDDVKATANNQFTVRASGGIRLRTSSATNAGVGASSNTGCDIPGNSGVLTCASSRFVKENYFRLNREDILLKIRKMPVMRWNYIGDTSGERHIGPFAEDFQAAFQLSPGDRSISAQDLAGVSLIGVQALEERTERLQSENEKLKKTTEALRQQIKQQQILLDDLKKLVCTSNPQADVCRAAK